MKRNRLLGLAIIAILGLAVLAPAGLASVTEAPAEESTAAQRSAQHAVAHAERDARRQALARQRAENKARRDRQAAEGRARTEERRAARAIRHALPHGHKVDDNAEVAIDCDSITVHYFGFKAVEGSPNSVVQMVVMKRGSSGLFIAFPTKTFTFEGTEATSVIPIAAPVGPSTVDIRSKWNTNENKGGFDIHESVKCGPKPAFAIEKLQSLGGPFTSEPLTGKVGQTVLYEMVVTNTGNTPLTFSNFSDAVCDLGTVGGVPSGPVEPLGSFTVVCAHTITAADLAAGSLVNVAGITGTPEEGEGSLPEQKSNEVVVTPKPEEESEKEKEEKEKEEKEKTPEEPKGGNENPPNTPSTTPTPKSGVLGTSGASSTSTSKSGVLGFASATVPSLRGPQGCVRSSVIASVKSSGVKSVVFYIDGHRLRTLGASAAHKGLISIRIDVSKMKVGPHHVKATITMKPVSAGGKAAKATRSLTVVRCHSAVVTPHFTG